MLSGEGWMWPSTLNIDSVAFSFTFDILIEITISFLSCLNRIIVLV